jgi:transposase
LAEHVTLAASPNEEVCGMAAYSMEFRRAVANAYDECGSSIEVAEQFDCSASWVRRLIQRRREAGGSLEPRPPRRPDNAKLADADLGELRRLIDATPDLTLGELAAALGNKVSVSTVWRATQAVDRPLKKKRTTRPSSTGRTWPRRGGRGSSSSPR